MRIKFLHIADLHLGARSYERSEGGRAARLAEFLAAVDWAFNLARAEGVHFVVVAGDVYDHCRPDPLVQWEWATRVARLRDDGLPVVIISGNHDRSSRTPGVSGQAVFGALSLPGVYVAAEPALLDVETAAGAVLVAAAPWRFGATGGGARVAEEELKALLRGPWAPRLAAGTPAIFAGHLWFAGGRLTSEGGMFLDDAQIAPAAVAHDAFSYYALGHLHMHQEVAVPAGGSAVYAGSLARLTFADEGVPKGAVVVEIGGGPARWRFVETSAREFVTVDIAAADEAAVYAAARDEAVGRGFGGAVVRVRISGPPELGARVNDKEITRYFEDAWDVRVVFVPQAAPRRRAGVAVDANLGDALGQYLGQRPPPFPVERDELLRRAAELEPPAPD